jgi:hypothetical protein
MLLTAAFAALLAGGAIAAAASPAETIAARQANFKKMGGAMKALNNYAQGAASDEFGKYNAQQMGIAQLGLQGAGIGAGVANANSAAIGQDANNRANAGMAGANAWSGIAGQVGGAFDRMRTPAPLTKMTSYG